MSASIEPVDIVALHIEGTKQVEANVQSNDEGDEEEESEASPAREVRLPHDPLYVNTCKIHTKSLSLAFCYSWRDKPPHEAATYVTDGGRSSMDEIASERACEDEERQFKHSVQVCSK